MMYTKYCMFWSYTVPHNSSPIMYTLTIHKFRCPANAAAAGAVVPGVFRWTGRCLAGCTWGFPQVRWNRFGVRGAHPGWSKSFWYPDRCRTGVPSLVVFLGCPIGNLYYSMGFERFIMDLKKCMVIRMHSCMQSSKWFPIHLSCVGFNRWGILHLGFTSTWSSHAAWATLGPCGQQFAALGYKSIASRHAGVCCCQKVILTSVTYPLPTLWCHGTSTFPLLKETNLESSLGEPIYDILTWFHPWICMSHILPRCVLLLGLVLACGGTWFLEQPRSSLMGEYERMQWFCRRCKVTWLNAMHAL